jgi:hypothetical protein
MSCELKEILTGYEADFLPPFFLANSTLSTHNSALASDGGEGGHSKSHSLKLLTLLHRGGQPPRNLPTRGTHPPVRIPPSGLSCSPTLSPLTPHVSHLQYGGEGGIRTHGPIAGTHAFQACRFDHSRTSPHRFSRGGILTRGLMTSKLTAGAHRQLWNHANIERFRTAWIEIAFPQHAGQFLNLTRRMGGSH